MKRKNFRPKKSLGQNFLYDPAIARKIAAAAVNSGDVVVELGAGRGILTRALAGAGADVIAVEVDRALAEALKAEFAGVEKLAGPRPEIIHADFTELSLAELLSARGHERCKLVGNIPYYLTRDVLFGFLVDEWKRIEGATIMIQREVGDRIVSPPGSRVYGITSVILQTLYDVRTVMKVLPGSFNPRPKVASIVLGFEPRARQLLADEELRPFVKLTKNVFQQRRKTIQNTLRAFYDLDEAALEKIHETTGIDLGLRPEALGNEAFIDLLRSISEVTSD